MCFPPNYIECFLLMGVKRRTDKIVVLTDFEKRYYLINYFKIN